VPPRTPYKSWGTAKSRNVVGFKNMPTSDNGRHQTQYPYRKYN